jgi:hypothetical protein
VSPTIVNAGPTTTEFIVSLAIVGVVGPILGILAAKWADRRKFGHDRKLKASDDFIERIDDVAKSFDELCQACSVMRMTAKFHGPASKDTLVAVGNAEDAHIRTRTLSARLKRRPHADSALMESALAAATSMNAAIEHVRDNNPARAAAVQAAGYPIVIGAYDDEVVEAKVREGLEHIEQFEAQARRAIGRLLS